NYNISAFDTNGNPFLISAPILPDWLLLSNEFPVGTFAGSESGYLDGNIADAKFNIPNGLVIDNLENFYIADVGNHCIRKITSQGEVYTLAGTGDEGYVDGAGTIAQFNSPLDIAIDKSGNLYVADFYNHVIRKILPDGTVSTLAGTGEAGFKNGPGNESKFNFPSGLTVDTFGNVYVSDFINHRIRKIEPNGTTTTFAGSGKGGFVNGLVENAEFFYPSDVEIDASGNLYVSDYGNNSIRKIVLSAIVSTVAGTGEIGFVDGGRDLAKFYAPIRIVLDSVGNVYVADSKNFSIRKVTADGTTLTLAGNGVEGSKDSTGIHAQFRDILGIAIDNSDNLFVTDNNRIRKIETSPKLHGNPAGQVGLHPVQLKVTDTNGEYSTQDFNINVGEVIPPTALCNDTTLYLDENGNAKVIAFDIDNFSYDDSGIASLEIDKGIFTCDDVGSPVIVTLTVTDNYVNVANCIATVTALDTIKPVFEPIADVEVVVSLAVSETGIEYPEILVTDNCDVVLEQLDGLGPEGMFPVGKTIETWQATDGGGNSVELSFNVNVILDNIPVFDAIEDTIVDEDISVLHIPLENILYGAENEIEISVTLFDETKTNLISDINVNYTNGESLALLDIFISADMNGEAIIQIDVTDDENRSSTNDFKIIVTPVNDAPILVNPVADIEIQLPEMVKFRLGKGKGEIFDDVDDEILDVEIKTVGGNKIPGWIFWSNDTIYAHPTKRDTGYFNIEIIASDDEGLSATDTFEIYVKKQIVVGTDDIEIQTFDAILYPNPANGIVNVEMNLSFKELSLEVYNNIGQVVLKESYLRNEDIVFDMSGKVSGLYFARLTSEGKHIIKKLMVNKN
ncbi:MAG: T9SS type A sorting domain-containing protein, partial [Mariniphaga sp.]|nr:T9SS type A sorting domain-containing protein [Mariniphaga sp.]